jgi:hypothetical protein
LDAHSAFIPLGRTNYFQNFDSLVSQGHANFNLPGWAIGPNPIIFADDGNNAGQNTYSYGLAGSHNRALGLLVNGYNPNPVSMFGANFQNTGNGAINRLNISYTGEEWRLGAQGRGPERLQFQYSLNAGSLMSGSWINVPGLDFLTPNLTGVGAHNGTLAANQTQISGSIGFLNIPVGATFWVRWVDAGLPGNTPGDGLAVDNFLIAGVPEASTWCGALAAIGLLGGVMWKRRSLGLNFA